MWGILISIVATVLVESLVPPGPPIIRYLNVSTRPVGHNSPPTVILYKFFTPSSVTPETPDISRSSSWGQWWPILETRASSAIYGTISWVSWVMLGMELINFCIDFPCSQTHLRLRVLMLWRLLTMLAMKGKHVSGKCPNEIFVWRGSKSRRKAPILVTCWRLLSWRNLSRICHLKS